MPTMITSSQNSKVKLARRLVNERRMRTREGAFVIEGNRWLEEIVSGALSPLFVLATPAWLSDPANRALAERAGGSLDAIEGGLLRDVAGTDTPPGVLAVVPIRPQPIPENPDLLLILDAVRDPGNLGTMIRAAGAAGVNGLLLGPGTVDPYNPKVVRAGMGGHLRLPLLQADWKMINKLCQEMDVWLAEGEGGQLYTAVDWTRPSALIIGSESAGPGNEARKMAAGTVTIPMKTRTESLNAAMAASIILFEAVRQRAVAEQGFAGE